MLNSLICASNGFMIFCFVFDAILILGAIGLFVWYYIKSSKNKQSERNTLNEGVEKINDDTYVIASDEALAEPVEVAPRDNAVEHFANQISGINEEVNNELNSTAVVVTHEVERPVKKVPKKDEIQNYVMVGGVKKEKTESEKVASHNRGTDAFKNSTNFLNIIKEEQNTAAEKKSTATTKKKTTK